MDSYNSLHFCNVNHGAICSLNHWFRDSVHSGNVAVKPPMIPSRIYCPYISIFFAGDAIPKMEQIPSTIQLNRSTMGSLKKDTPAARPAARPAIMFSPNSRKLSA